MNKVELVPMTKKQFQDYLELAVLRYAAENVKAGYREEEDAERKSREDHLQLLPDGLDTPSHFLMMIRDKAKGEEVGALWFKIEEDRNHNGFIYDLFLKEEHRGKGLSKATMLALERLAKKKGSRSLYLHVFAHNSVAIHLYEESGFEIKSMNMEKRL